MLQVFKEFSFVLEDEETWEAFALEISFSFAWAGLR